MFPEGREINLLPAGGENILDLDFRQWLAVRRLQIVKNAEHAFAGALSQRAMQLPFVKRARVDLQTSLGGRKGAGGVDVAGALRETDDDIVGWQLRAYAGEDSAKGLNSGVFYRRVVNGALAGVNVFADYEDGDDGDFWRWSIGGDVKNRFGELSANHYFAITDSQVINRQNTYTREGYDVDVAARIPRLEWAKARVGYYNFKGEFGDEDENGFRAGLDLSPGAGLVVGVEYDDDDGKFGGNFSYTHTFGATQQSAQRAGHFNPRAHFYDSARREYSQRISRASGGGGGGGLIIVGTGADVEVRSINTATTVTATVNLMANAVTNSVFPIDNDVIVNKSGGGAATIMRQGGAWHLTLSANAAEVAFLGGTVMSVVNGRGTFNRTGGGISEVVIAGVRISLLGTRFDFDSGGNITLYEGGLSMAAAGNVSVEVADSGASVQVGNVVARCGAGGMSAAGVNVKCAIADAVADVLSPNVTLPTNNILLGRITLGGADMDVSVAVTPAGFFAMTNRQTIINVLFSSAAAVAAIGEQSAVQVRASATLQGGALQTVRGFVFNARINRPPRQEMVTITSAAQNSAAGYTPTLTITQAMDITITSASQLAQAGVAPTQTITAELQSITVTSAEQLTMLGVAPTLTMSVYTLLASLGVHFNAVDLEMSLGNFRLTQSGVPRQLTITLAGRDLRLRTNQNPVAYAPDFYRESFINLALESNAGRLFTITSALPAAANVDSTVTLGSFAPTTTLGVFSSAITIGHYDPPIE